MPGRNGWVGTVLEAFTGELYERIRRVLPKDRPVYLVGGAVRDALLGKESHDLDFVLKGDPRPVARRVADHLGGAYYLLDDERNTGRVIITKADDSRTTLDFAGMRGSDLESDLRDRDFTVNAMAVNVQAPDQLIDPLDGAKDLVDRRLRACSPAAFEHDPVRILRGLRLALAFGFSIQPETTRFMREAVPFLGSVSPERRRDELFKILDGPRPAAAIRGLDRLGALSYELPELDALKGVTQSLPHIDDVWTHTLSVLQNLEEILEALQPGSPPEKRTDLWMGMLSQHLGRFRAELSAHLGRNLNPQRSLRALLMLAALYHDISKPATWQMDEDGRIRNLGHEQQGSEVAERLGRSLLLSNDEIARLAAIVRHHMRIHSLVQTGSPPSRRAVYRFFRDTGEAGIDVCLLTLADTLATYGPGLPMDVWVAHLEACQVLMKAWWEEPAETVSPPRLVDGNDLQAALGLPPGPVIGRILEAIREAQADQVINDREEAIAFAQEWVQTNQT